MVLRRNAVANKHEIELFISDDGEIKVHIKGMKGPQCTKVLDEFAKEGAEKQRELTAEYYEKARDVSQAKIKKQP